MATANGLIETADPSGGVTIETESCDHKGRKTAIYCEKGSTSAEMEYAREMIRIAHRRNVLRAGAAPVDTLDLMLIAELSNADIDG